MDVISYPGWGGGGTVEGMFMFQLVVALMGCMSGAISNFQNAKKYFYYTCKYFHIEYCTEDIDN